MNKVDPSYLHDVENAIFGGFGSINKERMGSGHILINFQLEKLGL